MPGILQRGRDAIKHRLDRRYVPRDEIERSEAAVQRDLAAAVDARTAAMARIDQVEADASVRTADLSGRLEALTRELTELTERQERTDAVLATLTETLRRLEASTGPAVAFVGHEDPHELRKRLYEAHRLAREGAFAIEQLLQEELLIKRDLATFSDD